MSTASPHRITPEELLKLPDGERYELVDGNLVEKSMSTNSLWVATWLSAHLVQSIFPRRMGYVVTEGMYQCFADPGKVRRPDVSFIAKGRLTDAEFEAGYVHIAPDLAVEVVSPNDLYFDVERKAEEYLAAGVRLVWIINPEICIVDVFRVDGSTSRLRGSQMLEGEEVVPGFSLSLQDLFSDTSELRRR